MPIQGFTRLRKHQFGKQSAFGTPIAATRVFPYRGVLNINLNWTDPDVDVGSIDPVLAPFRVGSEVTGSYAGPLIYDDIPTMYAAGVIGAVAPTGGGLAKTWTYTANSTTATTLDYFTDEWGDDVTTDGAQAFGGVVEKITWSFDEGMGAWQSTTDWRFANVNRPVAPTGGVSVGSNVVFVYGTDTSFWINDTSGAIGTTQIVDAVHGMTHTITNTFDIKRFANGSNAVGRFGIIGFGLTSREIMTEITFAKTTESIAETAKWFNADAQNRYIEIRNISPTVVPTTATPYSLNIKTAGRWYTRQDGEQGGNSTIVLGCKSFYDASGLGYVYRGVTVNSRTAL